MHTPAETSTASSAATTTTTPTTTTITTTTTTTRKAVEAAEKCIDYDETCAQLANFCKYKESLRLMCPFSCNSCNRVVTTPTVPTITTTTTTTTEAIQYVKVTYINKGVEREAIVSDISDIIIPQEDPLVMSAILNIHIKDMDWDDSFADESGIMFQILKADVENALYDVYYDEEG